MRNLVAISNTVAVLAAALAASGVEAAEALPLAGCYERVYDAAHLRQHPRQLVVRATLGVAPDTVAQEADKTNPLIASGVLKFWVRGRPKSFDSTGACWADGAGLLCNGSSSAAEAATCKSAQDGVRQCRINGSDSGSFKIESTPDGVLVSVRDRLELVPAPYDAGPYLYFSPANPENHAFLLTRKLPEACK
jgi:hypothetical protein